MKAGTRRSLRWIAGVIGCVAAMTGLASTASAALPLYELVAQSIKPASSGVVGDYVNCPAGSTIVNGGTFTWPGSPSSTVLRSSTPTFQGDGWYVDGRTPSVNALVAFLMCLPASELANARLLTTTYRSDFSPLYTGYSACPAGTRVYGGGGFFHEDNAAPDPFKGQGRVFASMPDGNGWYFGASHDPGYAMTVSARCLPSDRIVVRQVSSGDFRTTSSNSVVNGAAECQGPFRVLMGGAWWHTNRNSSPRDLGYLSSSVGTTDQRGWRASGRAFTPGAILTIVAFCIDVP
jgi:hypothetical protein